MALAKGFQTLYGKLRWLFKVHASAGAGAGPGRVEPGAGSGVGVVARCSPKRGTGKRGVGLGWGRGRGGYRGRWSPFRGGWWVGAGVEEEPP